MQVFKTTLDTYMAETEALVAEWSEAYMAGEEVASEDELMNEVIGLFGTVFADAVANATYAEPQTTTVRVEKVDNCCVKLRVLALDSESGSYVATDSFVTVNLKCMCVIKCLSDLALENI